MKQVKPSDSWLSGLSTPLLGVVAIIATLYTFGAVQNWSFIESEGRTPQLKWERDFVDHLDKCNHSPSSLQICERAFQKTVAWLKTQPASEERASLTAPVAMPEYPVRSIRELKARAISLAEKIPLKLESTATVVALNSWLGQIDRYSHIVTQPDADIKSRSWQLFANQRGITTLKISDFNSPEMCSELKNTLKRLQEDHQVYNLRLDLRGNPGGLIESALCVGDLLVPKGSVLARFEKKEPKFPFNMKATSSLMGWVRERLRMDSFTRKAYRGMIYAKSIDVILDRNSASAAEMLAAGLKDTGRARILGEKSYGKSTIQLPRTVEDFDGINAMITTYQWYRPSGTSISATQGIIPDQSLSL